MTCPVSFYCFKWKKRSNTHFIFCSVNLSDASIFCHFRCDEHRHCRNSCTGRAEQEVALNWNRGEKMRYSIYNLVFGYRQIWHSKVFPFSYCFLQLAIANPKWQVVQKLKVAKLVDRIGRGRIFMTVGEAVAASIKTKLTSLNNC